MRVVDVLQYHRIVCVNFNQSRGILSPVKTDEVLLVHPEKCIQGVARNVDNNGLGEHKINQI